MTSKRESHLLVVLALRSDPETDELIAVEIRTVVEVSAGAVLLITVALAVGDAVGFEAAGFEFGLVAEVVGTTFAVAQYRE